MASQAAWIRLWQTTQQVWARLALGFLSVGLMARNNYQINSYRSTGLPAGTVVIICIVVFGSRAANFAVCDINGPLFDGLTGVYAWGAQSCAVPGVDLPPSPKSPSVGRLSAHHRG